MNLALFDFDGTITDRDTFAPFIYSAVSRVRVALGAALLSPMIAAYQLGVLPATRMRRAMAWMSFWGRGEEEVNEAGIAYAKTLNNVLRKEALGRLRWHRDNGDQIVVVSASLGAYLRPWCEGNGLELICTELEARAGVLSGRYAGGDCSGAEKMRRVLARYDLGRYEVVYAYGDTEEDRELIGLAHKRYFRWQEVAA
jgi:HAD superfamily hydrolase (TIGR01490 family)